MAAMRAPRKLFIGFGHPSSMLIAHRLVRDYVRGCAICQRNKTEHLRPAGLLQPWPIPEHVWSDIAMDFVEGFPRVGGKSVILTVVDRFPRWLISSP